MLGFAKLFRNPEPSLLPGLKGMNFEKLMSKK